MKPLYIQYILVLLLGAGTLSSCFSKSQKIDTEATNRLGKVVRELGGGNNSALSGAKYVFIIPIDAGCETCIEKSLRFAVSNRNPTSLCIITSASQKSYNSRISFYLDGAHPEEPRQNLLIDKANRCFLSGVSDIMPRLYKVSEGNVVEVRMVDASNLEKALRDLAE